MAKIASAGLYVVVGSGDGEVVDGDGEGVAVGEGDVVLGDGDGDGDDVVGDGDGDGDGEVVVGEGDGDGDDGFGDGDPGDRECEGDGDRLAVRVGTGSTPSGAGVSPSAPGYSAGACRVPCLSRPAAGAGAGEPGKPATARRCSPVPTRMAAESGLMAVGAVTACTRAPATSRTTSAAEAASTRGAVRHAGGWAGKPSPPSGPTRSASTRG
jgi:hypothetical protein